MSESTAACVRGCGLYRRHLVDCEGATDQTCRGCLPRRAEYGRLCWPCHRRFELMLHDAPGVHRWLTGNMATGQGTTEDDMVTGTKEQPLPIKADLFDTRELLADRLTLWVDDLCEHVGLTGPNRHGPAADAKFLRTWLGTVEKLEWIGDWWEELAVTLSEAHALAPWRPAVRRCSGVPCPECEETSLIIFGGEEDVTCGACGTIIPASRFGIWTKIIADEQVASA